ncbi:MAG: sigma-54 dependent transcriptional regulator [Vicinamibacterales bacterium]
MGRVLELAHAPASEVFRARALRLWRHRRNVLALIEAESFGQPAMPLADYDRDPRFSGGPVQKAVALPERDRPLAVLDSIASAFDMSGSPLLLAEELRQLAEHVGVSSYVRVHAGRGAIEPAEGEYSVGLGTERKQHVSLICTPAGRVSDNVALSGITRVARSAVTLERLRSEERERAALWPMSNQEIEGALYIDEQMTSLLATARKVAAVNVPALITGETGTGKEVLARTIHAASGRAGGVMVPFNCASCPRDMIDAQLFGHRRGAFTGAVESAPGVIRAAAGGTLFLDEIGDAPLDIQPKLLRFLESGEVHPIGEPRPSKVDVRVIAATNVDLVAAVSAGRFREDLYYRLNIVTLHIPPLRERRSEIPVLANYYLQKCAMEHRKGRLRLAEETVEYLLLYRWPGNVRQLANEIRRMAALAENDQVLMPEHLSLEIAASRRTIPPSDRPLDVSEIAVRIDQPMAAAIEYVERAMVIHALEACGGRVEDTARRLGLSRKGLYLKRQRFGMESAEPQKPQWA